MNRCNVFSVLVVVLSLVIASPADAQYPTSSSHFGDADDSIWTYNYKGNFALVGIFAAYVDHPESPALQDQLVIAYLATFYALTGSDFLVLSLPDTPVDRWIAEMNKSYTLLYNSALII